MICVSLWRFQPGWLRAWLLSLQAAPDRRLPAVWRKDYVLRELDMEQVGTVRIC